MAREIEQLLIGALCLEPGKIPLVRAEIGPESFLDSLHSRIFHVMATWEGEPNTLTAISLATALRGDADLEQAGGRNYLSGIAGRALWAEPDILHLASMIREEALREDALGALEGAIHELNTSPTAVRDALRQVMVVGDTAAASDTRRRPKLAYDIAGRVVAQAERSLAGDKPPSVTTGLKQVDDKIGGMQGGDFILFPGRSGMGKSALLGGISARAALAGHPTLVFSLEMMADQWMQRVLTDLDFDAYPHAPMLYQDFRRGAVSQHHVARAAEAMLRLHDAPLEICDSGDLTIEDIAARARAFKAKYPGKIGLVVVDYAQRVEPSPGKKDRSREQEVAHIARGLKGMAKTLDWPVAAGAQLLSKGQDPKTQYKEQIPTLAAIRESGSLEMEPDIILAPHRKVWFHTKTRPDALDGSPEMEAWRSTYHAIKNSLKLYGLKFRHGGEFVFDLFAEMKCSSVRDEKPIQSQAEAAQADKDAQGLLV